MAEKNSKNQYVAVVRIRGMAKIRSTISDTMDMLNLGRKHSMVIREATPAVMGMIKKCKDYVTYGFVDDKLVDRYGVGKTINLHPPRGGFRRGGIKKSYSIGGVLGFRGDKIADLIEKMSPHDTPTKTSESKPEKKEKASA